MTDTSRSPAVETLSVDSIPGILDESTLSHLLEVELARARRYEHPFSLMRVGVTEGDGALLRHAAGALRLHTRWADSVGVFEDGTLLVVLRDTMPEAAVSAARKIRVAVCEEMGPQSAAMTLEIAAWRKGDDRPRLLSRFRPLDYDA